MSEHWNVAHEVCAKLEVRLVQSSPVLLSATTCYPQPTGGPQYTATLQCPCCDYSVKNHVRINEHVVTQMHDAMRHHLGQAHSQDDLRNVQIAQLMEC